MRTPLSLCRSRYFRGTAFPLLLIVTMLLALGAGPRAADRVVVTILATTDLHGYLVPFDYYTNQPANRGLAKAATIIRKIRQQDPAALLVDCGDTIEGSPLVNYYAHQLKYSDGVREPNPMMLAMNELDYSAMVVGNHEFNFGLDAILYAKKDAQFPWISANVEVAPNPQEVQAIRNRELNTAYRTLEARVFTPMIVDEVRGVTVAIIGLTTPATVAWERPENIAAYKFEDMVTATRDWVKHARTVRDADIVIVAAHSGLERGIDDGAPRPGLPGENAVYELATKVSGIDGIFFGHTHQELSGKSVNGVLLAQPKLWGQSVARMTFTLEKAEDSDHWKIISKTSETIPVTPLTEADPEILKIAEPYHQAAQKYLDTKVADSKVALDTRLGRIIDTPAIEAIHEAQLAVAPQADVSLTVIGDPSPDIPAGPVTIRQLFRVYPFENSSLVLVDSDGAALKAALEQSARLFVGSQGPGYLFEAAAGRDGALKYKIDVSKPEGERIVDLRWKNAPLKPDQRLRIAINNYLHGGSGGAMFTKSPVIWQSEQDIREMMVAYFTKRATIEPPAADNWEIVPESTRKSLIAQGSH